MNTRIRTLIALGILTIVVPLLGIPSSWKSFFLAIVGVVVIVLAVLINKEGVEARVVSSPSMPEAGGMDGVSESPKKVKVVKEEKEDLDEKETTEENTGE